MNLESVSFQTDGSRPHWVRLRTLIYLRWMAIAGQAGAVLIAAVVLELQLRLDLCLLLIGLSALFNIGATLIHPENKRLDQRDATLTLIFDIGQLAALLYLTGGMTNPFAVLILAQTIIAATVLTLGATVLLASVSLLVIGGLSLFHIPLTLASGEILSVPPLLLVGSWAAMSITVVFLGTYARRVTEERYSMSDALMATQLALEREQKLTALGGVVAAAAHELGTPLATIKLVSTELQEELGDQEDLAADAALIREQADRCRDILASMGRSGKEDLHIRFAPLSAVVEEAAEPHLNRGKRVILRVRGSADLTEPDGQPEISRRSEIIHGLRNLVQNAVDFAKSTVWIDMDWTDTRLILRIGDDGNGYPPDLIGRIGDPYVRRRFNGRRDEELRPAYEGMGLGLFIAKTLLERTGAHLTFANGVGRTAPSVELPLAQPTGAIVEVVWPLEDVIVSRETVRGALGENRAI